MLDWKRLATPLAVGLLAVTSPVGEQAQAELPDEEYSEFTTSVDGNAFQQPPPTHLILMPTFETLPEGQFSAGAIEILLADATFAPTGFLQIGATVLALPNHTLSLGAKAKVLSIDHGRAGLAVGVNRIFPRTVNDERFEERYTTLYVVAGTRGSNSSAHFGYFNIESRSVNRSYFAGIPSSIWGEHKTTTRHNSLVAVGGSYFPQGWKSELLLEV